MKMKSCSITKPATSVSCFCLFIFLATFFSPAFALEDCHIPAIFNFGDSNSDTGAYAAAFSSLPLPYGRTYFHRPSGRFSDGRLLIDFIANSLDLPFVSAYLDSLGGNYTNGANFAIVGGSIKPLGKTIANTGLSPLFLAVEYSQFQLFKSRSHILQNQGGVFANLTPKDQDFSRALYVIEIGQNDITYALLVNNMSVGEVNATVPDLVNVVSQHVKALYHLGGRSFWIHNTGPVGCLAFVLSDLPVAPDDYDNAGCGKPFNVVAQYHNQLLKEAVAKLRTELPFAAITYVDIYSIKYSLFSQPQKYGFVQPLVVCCGTGGKYNYSSAKVCRVTGSSCSNPFAKVNWDGIHFTEAANKVIFDEIITGKFSDPPIPPRLACHKSAS